MKTKIVITGSYGFVGKALVDSLNLNTQYEIIEVDKVVYKTKNKLINYDIADSDIGEIIECDFLIHLAAYVDSIGDPKQYQEINIEGTKNVLKKFPAKTVIYMSSSSVYTGADLKIPFKEEYTKISNYPIEKLSYYGNSKLQAEREIIKSTANHFIIRPHIIYGEGDTTLLPKLKKAIVRNHFIVPVDGRATVSITNIKNLVEFIQLIINSSSNKFGIYNFCDEKNISIKELFDDASKALRLKDPIFISILGNKLVVRIIQALSNIFGRKSRFNQYLIDSLNHDHILDTTKFNENYLEFQYKQDWALFMESMK